MTHVGIETTAELVRDLVRDSDLAGRPVRLGARGFPANVLTTDGTICGVIDFGDLCAGDPAYDPVAVWLLLPEDTIDHVY